MNSRFSKKYAFDPSRVECVLVPKAQLPAFMKARKADKTFPASATFPDKKDKSFALAFTEGGSLEVVAYDPKAGAFEFHTELRKTLMPLLQGAKKDKLVFNLSYVKGRKELDALLGALASLAALSQWKVTTFGKRVEEEAKKAKEDKELALEIVCALDARTAQAIWSKGVLMGEANNRVRTLAELPASELTPRAYMKIIQGVAKDLKANFKLYNRAELKKLGANAFLAVAKAAPDLGDGIVCLKHSARGAKKTVAIVGKGICFDTGGYNLKPGMYMHTMHRDMTGSAVALSLFEYLVKTKAPYNLECWMAITENHLSPEGFKMNEIVTAVDGTTIEVAHTDAEGRMVLADTLALVKKGEPDLCIDFATLTGTCVGALDTRKAGVMSNEMRMLARAVETGYACGERVWGFAVDADDEEQIKSEVADVLQCSLGKNADQVYAAGFLRRFIGPKTPWLHVDLSCEENKGGLGLVPTAVTGFGVRFGAAFIEAQMKGAR